MFTGLVEAAGTVRRIGPQGGGVRLVLETELAGALMSGDSLATNGVCLTVVSREGATIALDVSPETLRVTNLSALSVGDEVNLERSLRPDSFLGGHFVQGHVDGTGTLEMLDQEGDYWRGRIRYPASLAPLLVPKGSVAVDGISLTVASLSDETFEVQIIPVTWGRTNLRTRRRGDAVNLEGDMLGKYVLRLAELGGWSDKAGWRWAKG